jgi:hypothetical protein
MRKQQALAIVGTSLSITATRKVTAEPVEGDNPPAAAAKSPGRRWRLFGKDRKIEAHHTTDRQTESWVGWYFRALVRAAPLVSGSMTRDLPAIRQAILAVRRERAAGHMEQVGEALFWAACAIIVIEILLAKHLPAGAGITLGILAVALPALSAALVGIKSFAELEVMARQSRRMSQTMMLVERRLQALDLAGPLASRELTAEVRHLAAEMLSDVAGWTQISRVKALGLS